MKTATATAPSAWAPFLLNGDASGLPEHERARADDWLLALGHGYPVACEDAGFIHVHGAYGFWPYGADCQSYSFHVHP